MAVGSNTLTAFVAAANGTDTAIVAAVPGRAIGVVAVILSNSGAAITTSTFNTKPAGAGTAISGPLTCAVNGGGYVLTPLQDWFRTNIGEGLSLTNAAATSVTVVYRLI